MQRKYLLLILVLLIVVGCDIRYGTLESQLKLSTDSRWPKWFDLPAGYSREDLELTFSFYSHPWKSPVVITVRHRSIKNTVLLKIVGSYRPHPLTKERGYANFPAYTIITVNNISEVTEQPYPSDILYITDDPAITSVIKKN